MKPLLLRIRRKTLVPVNGVVHNFRSDWKKAGRIEYHDSIKIFKSLGGNLVEKESQFAKFLYDNLGEGEYSILANCKGRRGFWAFYHVILMSHGFIRKKRNKTIEENQKTRDTKNLLNLKKQVHTLEGEHKASVENEIEELEEELDLTNEFIKIDRTTKKSFIGYFEPTSPAYKIHQYEDYKIKRTNVQEVQQESFW